jgi:hypothetical protein
LRKRRLVRRQVGAGKANVSEPLGKRRKRSDVVETGVQSLPRDEPGGCLLVGQAVTGVEVARAWFRRWHRRWEPVAPAAPAGWWTGRPKGAPKQRKLRGAEDWCGRRDRPARSSGEAR